MAAKDATANSPSQKDVVEEDQTLSIKPSNLKAPPPSAPATTTESAPEQETATEAAAAAAVTLPTYQDSQQSNSIQVAKALLNDGEFDQALEALEQGIHPLRELLESHGIEPDLHPSLAPYYYWYGTTLLYSLEESDQAMTVAGAAASAAETEVPATAPAPEGDEEEDEAEMPTNGAPEEAEPEPEAPPAEDMEIAWENLDSARTLLETLLKDDHPKDVLESLELDLAQVLLREGDLQRINGRFVEAVEDYQACLERRKAHLGPLDRKIADVHYHLGLSHLSYATLLAKDNGDAALIEQHSQMALQSYLDCAKALSGQCAALCGVEAEQVWSTPSNLKTTGLTETMAAADTLRTWRTNLSTLSPIDDSSDSQQQLEELLALLQEIQETMDEAESSQTAVRQAADLKRQAQQAVESQHETSENGVSTQVGFDAPSTTAVAAARPLVVKKKRPPTSTAEPDTKRPKAE